MRTITILTTTKLFSGVYLWNYFQKYPSVFELFPAYMSVSGIISRHICVCLELFPDICCSSVWKYFETYMSVSGIISSIHVSVWKYFQKYMCLSGIISRHTLQECLEIFRGIYNVCQCLELFPDIYVSGIMFRHTLQQCLEIF